MEHDPFWLHAEAILHCCRNDDPSLEEDELPVDAKMLLKKINFTHSVMKSQVCPSTLGDRILLGQHTRALLRAQLSEEGEAKKQDHVKDANEYKANKANKTKAKSAHSTPVRAMPPTISTFSPSTPVSVADLALLDNDTSGGISPRRFRRTRTPWRSPLDQAYPGRGLNLPPSS